MNCENKFCIYSKDDECILRKISLDECGLCRDCIYVDVDSSLLKMLKKTVLDKLDKDYNENGY